MSLRRLLECAADFFNAGQGLQAGGKSLIATGCASFPPVGAGVEWSTNSIFLLRCHFLEYVADRD